MEPSVYRMTTAEAVTLVTLVLTVCLELTSGFPTGAPLSACSHLMPLHMDGELMTVVSPYLLVLNDTTYGNSPIKCKTVARCFYYNMQRQLFPTFYFSTRELINILIINTAVEFSVFDISKTIIDISHCH